MTTAIVVASPVLAPWMSFALVALSVIGFGALLLASMPDGVSRTRIVGVVLAVIVVLVAANALWANVLVPCDSWGCWIDTIFW